jgi:hypothetical protein
MTLHVDFANCWPLILFAVVLITPVALMFISSIMRNDVTRLGIAHKNTSFWIESKRSPRMHAGISPEQTESKIVQQSARTKCPRPALPQDGGSPS